MARFLVQRHRAGRTHFDLRLVQDAEVRSWSLLKEPPGRTGEKRLAIEREIMSADEIGRRIVSEEAFGTGRVQFWDGGDVEIRSSNPEHLVLIFAGVKLSGPYHLRRMRWYPGNRWMLEKSGTLHANLT